jgi:integrase
MPAKKLNALSLSKLAAGEWYDSGMPGLILRVGLKRRTWQYRYHAGGSYHRKTLGHYPAMQLAEARNAARLRADRADKGVPIASTASHPRASTSLTLGALLDRYEALRAKEGRRTKTLPHAMRTLRQNLKPYLPLPADQFSKADLRAARDAIVERDALMQANRMLGYLGPVLRWAAQEDLIPTNFTPDIRRAPEGKRSRVLTRPEIAAIWRGCYELGPGEAARNFGRLVRFLLVTAQRRDEGASLRHGHILDGVWRQADNKADRPHSLTLPPLARSLIGEGAPAELAFAGRMGGKLSGFSKLKVELDRVSGVTDWRLHDLRRTAATHMQELAGVRNEVVQAILNHSLGGVGRVYLRSELEKQKAEVLRAWATKLTHIVKPARVVA